jgi:hypothetical protein
MNDQQSTARHFNIKKGNGRGTFESETTAVKKVDGRDARPNLLRETVQQTMRKK